MSPMNPTIDLIRRRAGATHDLGSGAHAALPRRGLQKRKASCLRSNSSFNFSFLLFTQTSMSAASYPSSRLQELDVVKYARTRPWLLDLDYRL
ncbi:hypothetical protein PsYK624_156540 [Phanerochaete sordida]|uniref:Uncharacterized protein n=1 Tax=Phanerochaete sordida TaxID=48140 RepID=A0A9P3LM65_9APHY|nr:hypothetical protein PsYK624_156540 [Phanerochaete sordida]